MALHILNARQVQTAPVGTHADGGGLFLTVKAAGASWVLRVTAPDGRRREMGPGPALRTTLPAAGETFTQARRLADKVRKLLSESRDPVEARESDRNAAKAQTADRKATVGVCRASFSTWANDTGAARRGLTPSKRASHTARTTRFTSSRRLPLQSLDRY